MSNADYLALGTWNAACFECGKKFKAEELRRHWQGYYVCKQHWEARQPQDFVRSTPDVQTPPWVQPMPEDVFSGPSVYTVDGTLTSDLNGTCVTFTADFTVTAAQAAAGTVFVTLLSAGVYYGPYPVLIPVVEGEETTLCILNNTWGNETGPVVTVTIPPGTTETVIDVGDPEPGWISIIIEGTYCPAHLVIAGVTYFPYALTGTLGGHEYVLTLETGGIFCPVTLYARTTNINPYAREPGESSVIAVELYEDVEGETGDPAVGVSFYLTDPLSSTFTPSTGTTDEFGGCNVFITSTTSGNHLIGLGSANYTITTIEQGTVSYATVAFYTQSGPYLNGYDFNGFIGRDVNTGTSTGGALVDYTLVAIYQGALLLVNDTNDSWSSYNPVTDTILGTGTLLGAPGIDSIQSVTDSPTTWTFPGFTALGSSTLGDFQNASYNTALTYTFNLPSATPASYPSVSINLTRVINTGLQSVAFQTVSSILYIHNILSPSLSTTVALSRAAAHRGVTTNLGLCTVNSTYIFVPAAVSIAANPSIDVYDLAGAYQTTLTPVFSVAAPNNYDITVVIANASYLLVIGHNSEGAVQIIRYSLPGFSKEDITANISNTWTSVTSDAGLAWLLNNA